MAFHSDVEGAGNATPGSGYFKQPLHIQLKGANTRLDDLAQTHRRAGMRSKSQDALKRTGDGDMRPLLPAALPDGRPHEASREQAEDVAEGMTFQLLQELTERHPNQQNPDPHEQQEKSGNYGAVDQEAFHVGGFEGLVAVAMQYSIEKDSERDGCEDVGGVELEPAGSSPSLGYGAPQTRTEEVMAEFRHDWATIFVAHDALQVDQCKTYQNDDQKAGRNEGRDAAGEVQSAAGRQKIVRIIR